MLMLKAIGKTAILAAACFGLSFAATGVQAQEIDQSDNGKALPQIPYFQGISSLAEQVEPALNAGDRARAERIVLHLVEQVIAQNNPSNLRYALQVLGSIDWQRRGEEWNGRRKAIARFLFETLKDHPVADLPVFILITNRASWACSNPLDSDCLRETSLAGVHAGGGIPETAPEEDFQRALDWRAQSFFVDERYEEMEALLPLLKKSALSHSLFRNFLARRLRDSFQSGDKEQARKDLLHFAEEPGVYSEAPDLNLVWSVFGNLDEAGELAKAIELARFIFDELHNHPIALTPQFIDIAAPVARYCANRGDKRCLREVSAAGMKAIGTLPEKRPSDPSMTELLTYRAASLVLEGQIDEAFPVYQALAYGEVKRGASLADDIAGLNYLGNISKSLQVELRRAALRELERDKSENALFTWDKISTNLSTNLLVLGRLSEAEEVRRSLYASALKNWGEDANGTLSAASDLGWVLSLQDRWDEAQVYFQRNWEIARSFDGWEFRASDELLDWTRLLIETGRVAEADKLTEKVWPQAQAAGKRTEQGELAGLINQDYAIARGEVLLKQKRWADAEKVFRGQYDYSTGHWVNGGAYVARQLAESIEQQSRYSEAEPFRRKAVEFAAKNLFAGKFNAGRISGWVALADNLSNQGKLEEAGKLYAQALSAARALEQPSQQTLGLVSLEYARHLVRLGKADEAARHAEIALNSQVHQLNLLGAGAGETAYLSALKKQRAAAIVTLEIGLTNGAGDADQLATSFDAAQRAQASSASSALSQNAAETLAQNAGAGEAVARWRETQQNLVDLDRQAAAFASGGQADDAQRIDVLARREAAFTALKQAEAELEESFPRFFNLARPAPAELTAVQATLEDDEALIVLVPFANERTSTESAGLVMALSNTDSAIAEIALDSESLNSIVLDLHTGLAAKGSGFTHHPDLFEQPTVFYSRDQAHQLYRALFADPAIEKIIAKKSQWTLAPQGKLLSVSYAALVTDIPKGGKKGDADPATLRATRWLGIERALAVTPSVSALLFSRNKDASEQRTSQPFFGFGDPAFKGVADPPIKLPEDLRERARFNTNRAPQNTTNYYTGPVANLAALAGLDRLPGTATEVHSLAAVLEAGPDSVVTQLAATEATVVAQSANGRLADTALIVFATHGLIASELGAGLAEPALALTPPTGVAQDDLIPSNDGLLTASEAAALHLAADWVILSACNTSAGAELGAQGLSGLARGFLYAGARSLLVSHFPVSDRATPLLTAVAVKVRHASGTSRAEAMRTARRKLLADSRHDEDGQSLAHPKAWAALALVSPSH